MRSATEITESTEMLFLCVLCVLGGYSTSARNLTFEWEPSADPSVTGYRLYVCTNAEASPSNALLVIDAVGTSVIWSNAVGGQRFWAFVTATNDCCESEPSNVIEFSIPAPPGKLKLNALRVTASVEASECLGGPFTWLCDLGTAAVPMEAEAGFYRVRAKVARRAGRRRGDAETPACRQARRRHGDLLAARWRAWQRAPVRPYSRGAWALSRLFSLLIANSQEQIAKRQAPMTDHH